MVKEVYHIESKPRVNKEATREANRSGTHKERKTHTTERKKWYIGNPPKGKSERECEREEGKKKKGEMKKLTSGRKKKRSIKKRGGGERNKGNKKEEDDEDRSCSVTLFRTQRHQSHRKRDRLPQEVPSRPFA